MRILLTIVFTWSMMKAFDVYARQFSFDATIFRNVGLGGAFEILIELMIVCLAVSIVWLWFPFRKGFLFAISAVVLNLVETSIACVIATNNTELAKQAYTSSRSSRGLSVNKSILESMNDPITQSWPAIISTLFAFLWIFLIVKQEEMSVKAKELKQAKKKEKQEKKRRPVDQFSTKSLFDD